MLVFQWHWANRGFDSFSLILNSRLLTDNEKNPYRDLGVFPLFEIPHGGNQMEYGSIFRFKVPVSERILR